MKKFLFLFLAILLMASAMAQSINLRFTGRLNNGNYVRLDSVKVENISRSWTEVLTYPDTVLIFNQTGIKEVSTNNATLKAFPNPFNGRTNLNLQLSNNDNITLQIFNFAGQKVVEYSQNLEAGNYLFDLSLKTPQVYLAVLNTSQGRSTIKMVNHAKGAENSIAVKGLEQITEKRVSTQNFQVGDVMRYTGYATIGGYVVASTQILQTQRESESFSLFFTAQLPIVTTDTITNITDSTATCAGNVSTNGSAIIVTCGVCYSTNPNPTTSDNIISANIPSVGYFHCNLANLTPNTRYYVRAYATNSIGTTYGVEKSFTTLALPIVTTDTITNITDSSATLQGNVTFAGGSTITSRGFCYSTSHNPTLNDSVVLATTNDTGTYTCNIQNLIEGTPYYIRAYATNSVGTTYGTEKSFTTNIQIQGYINGQFSVSDTTAVHFSQGNLQWSATGTHAVNGGGTAAGTWRFAEHQYDYVGDASNGNVYIGSTKCNNASISSSYTGWIDLFGWGTSGYNSKYPYMTSTTYSDYPDSVANSNYDWGIYNAISNGGNQPNMWRTLTAVEWDYLFNTRIASTINGTTNARYAEVKVNGIAGIMLFPDVFTWPSGAGTAPTIFNTYQYYWNSVNYTTAQFAILESSGVVFLPASGDRPGISVCSVNSAGHYWSSTFRDIYYCCPLKPKMAQFTHLQRP